MAGRVAVVGPLYGGLLLVLAGVWVVVAGPLFHRLWLGIVGSAMLPRGLPFPPWLFRTSAFASSREPSNRTTRATIRSVAHVKGEL